MSAPGAESMEGSSATGFAPDVPPLPADATPEQKDLHWFKHVYQGDRMPQLTWRAVLMGGLLGMLMAASNLYTTLAIGWAFGVAITACVMSFVIWNVFVGISGGGISRMSILENNCMQSTASAAGYSTGSTLATMFGAMLLLKEPAAGQTSAQIKNWDISPVWAVTLFTMGTGLLGVFLAIPLKRQMINHERLRFPSGVAAAETLRSLHSHGKEALRKAYVLIVGIVTGGIVGVFNAGEGDLGFLDRMFEKIKSVVGFSVRLPGQWPEDGFAKYHGVAAQSFGFEPSVLLLAAGVITRMRASLSMFIGAAALYWWVGPWLLEKDLGVAGVGWVQQNGAWVYDKAQYVEGTVRNITLNAAGTSLKFPTWSLWGGTAVMVFASLTALALQWKTIVRAFSGLGGDGSAASDGSESRDLAAAASVEVPTKWMVMGMIPISIMLLIVQVLAFNIAWWAGCIAIAVSFFLALVACRATGETDTTPIGAMGKVMQLMFAVFHPGQTVPNLASAGIAANSASSAADLLTDLKSGYLLGANPRKQFIAQFVGVFFGTLAVVPVWFLMVPTKEVLEKKFAAPATHQWEAVAKVLTKGIDYLPQSAQLAILFGAAVGVLLPILERLSPPSVRKYLPSAMGLGLSWVIPFSSAFGFFLGAVIGWVWELIHRKSADGYAVALASGLIAGESLIKAFIAMTATALGLLGGGSSSP